MYSPGRAILWQIVWRSRWGLLPAAAYLLLAVVLSHTLPASVLDLPMRFGDEELPAVGWYLGMPTIFINILLVAVFGMAGIDSKDSGFTKHMFVLPVRTSTLVAWPMLSGC